MNPSVSITKTDGNLNAAANTDRILAIIGPASAGGTNTPQAFSSKSDIVDEHTGGILVEAGSYVVGRGIPVVLVRGVATTAGDYGAIDDAGVTGTATVAEGATVPTGDHDVIVEVIKGGALGTAGITFRFSMDNGGNWSPETALGTSLTLTTDSGVSFTLSASADTLVAGDTWSVRTSGPKMTTSDLATSLDALKDYGGEWLRVLVLTDADATILAQLDAWAETFHALGKFPEVIANTRARNVPGAESRATYQTALQAIAAAVQSTEVSPCADWCEVVSAVNGRRLRMPFAIPYAARLLEIDDSVDAAAKALGALPGVFLTTAAGADDYHDELRWPGLDALGFTTARTFRGRPMTPGVFVNNPRLLSGAGSDYRYFQHTAVVNRVIETAYQLLEPKLSIDVLLDPTSGRIREDVAVAIEEACLAELRGRFVESSPARVSALSLTLSRTDDVATTDEISFHVDVVPKGYAKKFTGKVGLVRKLRNN